MTLINENKCCLCEEELSNNIILALPETPLANNFLTKKQITSSYSLDIISCSKCKHVQLKKKIDPNIIFKNYLYKSGVSQNFVNHFKSYVTSVTKNKYINKKSKILEIGANDGTLIKAFSQSGFNKLFAIEPAQNLIPKNINSDIKWISEFFDFEYSKYFLNHFGKMDLICANNVLAHSPNLFEIFKGINEILSDEGILTFEVSYLIDLLENSYFDMIYHEHYSYHNLLPIYEVLPKYGLYLIDVEKISTHGGSIRCYVSKTIKKPTERLLTMIEKEYVYFKDLPYLFNQLNKKIKCNAENLINKILINKNFSKNIIGFGAPAKLTTLFYTFDLFDLNIKCIIDDNDLKIGKFTPGANIPIKSYDNIKKYLPATIIVFAWNYFDVISKRLTKDFGDQVILINPMEN